MTIDREKISKLFGLVSEVGMPIAQNLKMGNFNDGIILVPNADVCACGDLGREIRMLSAIVKEFGHFPILLDEDKRSQLCPEKVHFRNRKLYYLNSKFHNLLDEDRRNQYEESINWDIRDGIETSERVGYRINTCNPLTYLATLKKDTELSRLIYVPAAFLPSLGCIGVKTTDPNGFFEV